MRPTDRQPFARLFSVGRSYHKGGTYWEPCLFLPGIPPQQGADSSHLASSQNYSELFRVQPFKWHQLLAVAPFLDQVDAWDASPDVLCRVI